MKSKFIFLSVLSLALVGGTVSCDDDMNLVGSTIQPPGDKTYTYIDSFQLKAKTVFIDSLYAKTTQALLGEYVDPLFGRMKAGYMCQFYCQDNFRFRYEPIGGRIDSIDFKLAYEYGWVGDSLAPMQAEVYRITNPLTDDYYVTNLDPAKYCDMSVLMGRKTYTAYDQTVPDSIRNQTDSNGNKIFVPNVTVVLPWDFGQQLYEATVRTPDNFTNQQAFNNYFPGFYITTKGSGNLLRVSASAMYIYYKYETTVEASDGSDSTVVRSTAETFNVTPEVIQLSHVENTDMDELLKPNDRLSYLKTPAGVYTQITFPIRAIKEAIGTERTITSMPFSLSFLPQDDWDYALTPPNYVLLLPKDSLQAFFEEGRLANSKTSFLSANYIQTVSNGYQTSYVNTYMYNFDNIAAFLQNQLETAPDKDIDMLIVPVSPVTKQVSNSYYGSQTVVVRLNNYFQPSGVKLVTDSKALGLKVRSARAASEIAAE